MPPMKHPRSPHSSSHVDPRPSFRRRKVSPASSASDGPIIGASLLALPSGLTDGPGPSGVFSSEQQTQDNSGPLLGCSIPPSTQPETWFDPSAYAALQSSGTLQQLVSLLQHSAAPFLKAVGHTDSITTRPPSPFDRHLPTNLHLKRVVHHPNLLRNIVDATVSKLQKLADDGFFDAHPSPNSHLVIKKQDDRFVKDETGITHALHWHFTRVCAAAASIIGLKAVPKGNKPPLVTKIWNTEGTACPDISLLFSSTACEEYPALAQKIQGLAKNHLTDFVVIEVKSLASGTEAILDEIIHSDWHGWEQCPGVCESKSYHNGREKRFDIPVGADGDISPYLGHAPLPADLTTNFESTLATDEGDGNMEKQHAFFIRTQAFSEAVEKNATFVIFFMGNNAAVALRHRDTQTLYISSKMCLVETRKEGDLSLCLMLVSVMVAAVSDALLRVNLATKPPRVELSASNQGNKESQLATTTQPSRQRKTLSLGIKRRNHLQKVTHITVRLGANIPVGEAFGTFVRESEAGLRTKVEHDKAGYSFRTTIAHGRAWLVRPFSSTDSDRQLDFSDKMIIKAATSPFDIMKLRKEYKYYLKLSHAGFKSIVKVHGLFSYIPPMKNSVTCVLLLMDNGGSTLLGNEADNEPLKAYLKALKTLHRLGFIHGRPDLNHCVLQKGDKNHNVRLISLAECEDIGKHTKESCPSNCTNLTIEEKKCPRRKLTYNEISAFAASVNLPLESLSTDVWDLEE